MFKTEINNIQIIPIKPNNGHIGFASFILNDNFYIGGIGIHTSPSSDIGYRLVYPSKNLKDGHKVPYFYPINTDSNNHITQKISCEYEYLLKELVN